MRPSAKKHIVDAIPRKIPRTVRKARGTSGKYLRVLEAGAAAQRTEQEVSVRENLRRQAWLCFVKRAFQLTR